MPCVVAASLRCHRDLGRPSAQSSVSLALEKRVMQHRQAEAGGWSEVVGVVFLDVVGRWRDFGVNMIES